MGDSYRLRNSSGTIPNRLGRFAGLDGDAVAVVGRLG